MKMAEATQRLRHKSKVYRAVRLKVFVTIFGIHGLRVEQQVLAAIAQFSTEQYWPHKLSFTAKKTRISLGGKTIRGFQHLALRLMDRCRRISVEAVLRRHRTRALAECVLAALHGKPAPTASTAVRMLSQMPRTHAHRKTRTPSRARRKPSPGFPAGMPAQRTSGLAKTHIRNLHPISLSARNDVLAAPVETGTPRPDRSSKDHAPSPATRHPDPRLQHDA